MNLAIAPAQPCDAVAINRVINAAYRVEDFFKVGDRTSVREIADYLEQETFLAARDPDGDIIGVVRVALDGERGHFGMLSVMPAAQGTGLGKLLIAEAERFARQHGCTWMDLEVASPREEMPPFYRKFGYEVSGTAEWPEDALEELKFPAHFIVMSKSLLP